MRSAQSDALIVTVFVYSPHGVSIKSRCDVIVLAGVHEMAGILRLPSQIFTPYRGARELTRDIHELLHPAANLLHVPLHTGTAVAQDLPGPPLVPVQSTGLNDLIQQPPLVTPAAHFAFSFDSHELSMTPSVQDPAFIRSTHPI